VGLLRHLFPDPWEKAQRTAEAVYQPLSRRGWLDLSLLQSIFL